MDLNPVWLADASFLLNTAFFAVIWGFILRHIREEIGRGATVVLAVIALIMIISVTTLTRGVVHDALVSQATTEQVESASQTSVASPTSTDTSSNDPESDYHIY